jgi:pimeloyl-ACP methyl ester carboxylesterase
MSGGVSLEGGKSNMMKMLKLFLPEALFPTEKNVKKLLGKMTGPDNGNLMDNEELMNHWKLLLKNFNNMSMGRHKLERFTSAEVDGMKKDALFLTGDADRLTYGENYIETADNLGLRYEIVKHAGHALNHEKPELVNERMTRFLSGNIE